MPSLIQAIRDNQQTAPPVETPTPVVSTPAVEPQVIEQTAPETPAAVVPPVTGSPATEPPSSTTEPVVTPPTPESEANKPIPASSNQGAIIDSSTPIAVPETPEYNFGEVLSQKFNSRFKSEAELERYIQDADKPRVEYANDFVASLDHAIKSGVNEQEFIRAYSLDPDKMSDREAIRQAEKIKNPSLTDGNLNRIISKKYDIVAEEGEDPDPNQVEDAKISETMDGGNAKRFLKEFKDKYKVELPNNEQLQAEVAQVQEANQAKMDQYVKDIDTHIADRGNQNYKISLNETQSYTYKPNTEQLNAVRSQVANLGTFFERYSGEGGTAKLFDDMFFAQNHEAILRSMAQAISNDGKKTIIDDLVVPGGLDSQNSPGDSTKSVDTQIAEQFWS